LRGTGYQDTADVWLGFADLGLKSYDEAGDYFRHYLDTHGKYGTQRVVGMAKLGLALYYEAYGRDTEANDFALEAYELLSQMNAQWELKQVRELLARLEQRGVAEED
jgi:hypothetical protein